ncbi:MAG TPA: hypothetical protein VK911_07205 [Vicinamibacterales bacterium]|nr:hypothetical protein [Vicinamibacterales bacterium]
MDLRVAIGLLFVLLGVLLFGFGLFSDPAIYAVSLGVNVNVRWGLVMLAFGLLMLGSAWKGRKVSE